MVAPKYDLTSARLAPGKNYLEVVMDFWWHKTDHSRKGGVLKVEVTSIFGGFSDKRVKTMVVSETDRSSVTITGTCMFWRGRNSQLPLIMSHPITGNRRYSSDLFLCLADCLYPAWNSLSVRLTRFPLPVVLTDALTIQFLFGFLGLTCMVSHTVYTFSKTLPILLLIGTCCSRIAGSGHLGAA